MQLWVRIPPEERDLYKQCNLGTNPQGDSLKPYIAERELIGIGCVNHRDGIKEPTALATSALFEKP